jgi:3-dehydroquinate dehydratase-2
MSILIASGVNLDLLGTREPEIYGFDTIKDMESLLLSRWKTILKPKKMAKTSLSFFQSNDESEFLEKISEPWVGIVLNAGSWTHTSLALADRLVGVKTPFVEVHLSNVFAREPFRHHSYLSRHAKGVVCGFGIQSYLLGLEGLVRHLST